MKVILITLHGARPDALGCYGGTLAETPHLDRLAAQSIVFDQHYLSVLRDENQDEVLHDPTIMVLDELTANLTASQGSSAYFADHRVIHYPSYSASWKHVGIVNDHDLPMLEQPTLSDGVLQHGIDWLQLYGQHYERWLLNLELGALLPPWREEEYTASKEDKTSDEESAEPIFDPDEEPSPSPSRFGWRAAYGGVVRYVDDLLGQFLRLLDELELTKDCMLIVQSSGGQPLGEYSAIPHRPDGIFEERAHLPLLIRFPNCAGAGRRVHHFTQPEDVLLTVAQCLKGEAPKDIQGDHLVRFTQGQAGQYREYQVSLLHSDVDHPIEACLRSKYWSLVLPMDHDNPRPMQLYRKPEDRWDMNNVYKDHPDVAEHLELTLRRYLAWKVAGCLGDPPPLREEVTKVLAE